MLYKKEIRNANKDKIIVRVSISTMSGMFPQWRVEIEVIPYRGRTSIWPIRDVMDSHTYRALEHGSDEEKDYIREMMTKWVSEEELQQILNEAWEMFKPERENIIFI